MAENDAQHGGRTSLVCHLFSRAAFFFFTSGACREKLDLKLPSMHDGTDSSLLLKHGKFS